MISGSCVGKQTKSWVVLYLPSTNMYVPQI